MKKRYLLAFLVFLSLSTLSLAEFPSDVNILERPAIAKLSDEALIDAYENTIVEIEASRTFHATSGFSPREYKDYKALLKYRLLLAVEIKARNLELPQF